MRKHGGGNKEKIIINNKNNFKKKLILVFFLFIYIMCMFFIGLPVVFLEMSLGQYTSLQSVTLFDRMNALGSGRSKFTVEQQFSGVGILSLLFRLTVTMVLMDFRYAYMWVTAVLQPLIEPSQHWHSCWMKAFGADDRKHFWENIIN